MTAARKYAPPEPVCPATGEPVDECEHVELDDNCDPDDPCRDFHACYRHQVGPFSPWDAPFRCGRCERLVSSRFRCIDAERGALCMDCWEAVR